MSTTSRSRNPAAARTAILDAAEQLFSDKGFAATRMRDLALAAGASKALIHTISAPPTIPANSRTSAKRAVYEALG